MSKKLGIIVTPDGLMLSFDDEHKVFDLKVQEEEWILVNSYGEEVNLGKPKKI